MATRSRIGLQFPDGHVESIYCHWDGYPEHNGKILAKHYTLFPKILQLIQLGDLSSLGPEIGEKVSFDTTSWHQCVAYGRDRGDKEGVQPECFSSWSDYLKAHGRRGDEYSYLYQCTKERWVVFDGYETEVLDATA